MIEYTIKNNQLFADDKFVFTLPANDRAWLWQGELYYELGTAKYKTAVLNWNEPERPIFTPIPIRQYKRKIINTSLPKLFDNVEIQNGIVTNQWQYYARTNGRINQDLSLIGQPSPNWSNNPLWCFTHQCWIDDPDECGCFYK